MVRPVLLFTTLLLFACVASPQEQPRTFRVTFHTVNGLILLDATVNGKPQTFILDTGAQVSLLDRSLAGLEKQKAGNNVNGVIDTSKMGRVVSSLCIGTRCLSDRSLGVVDYEKVSRALGVRVDGQIGQDILRQFSAVRIDFKNQVVELETKQ